MALKDKMLDSVRKFDLDLSGKTVLTEAATGNYVVTPLLAACAGATVLAYTKDSHYGSVKEVVRQTQAFAKALGVEHRINVVTDIQKLDLQDMDVVTNTGFLRPIHADFIQRLSPECVIPLMWEPWEFRPDELDLAACYAKGIKVYGTNESDTRVRTMEYLGFVVLSLMLAHKRSPFGSNKVLLVGSERFVAPSLKVLARNGYRIESLTDYDAPKPNVGDFDVVVIMEHERNIRVVAPQNAFIEQEEIRDDALVIHICGDVSFDRARFSHQPEKPSPFGYMSYTADYADSQAVIDLHAAGLCVAQGMLQANSLELEGEAYKAYMESNYPALAFPDFIYW